MKKFSSLAIILAAGTVMSALTPLSSAAADYYLPGDATGDGVIKVNDVVSINSFLAGSKKISSVTELRRYDANSDYSIDQKDAKYLKDLLSNNLEKSVKKVKFDNDAFIQGDINGDGYVKTNDISLLSKIVAQATRPADIMAAQRYDVNEDGKTDNDDVALVKKMVALSVQPKYIKYYSKTFIQGDVNGDGTVSMADVSSLNNFLNNARIVKSGRQQQRLDVNIDGIYNSSDTDCLKKILAGKQKSKTVTYSEAYGLPEFEDLVFEAYDPTTGKLAGVYNLNPGYLADKEAYWYPSITERKEDNEAKVDQKASKHDYGITTWRGGTVFAIDSHTLLTAGHVICNREKISKSEDLKVGSGSREIKFKDKKSGKDVTLHMKYILMPRKYTDTSSTVRWQCDLGIITVEEDLTELAHLDKSDLFDVSMVSNNIASFKPTTAIAGYPGGIEKLASDVKITNIFDYTIDVNTWLIGGTSGGPMFIRQADGRKAAIGIVRTQGFGARISPTMYSYIKNIPAKYR
ncbi:MAG: hypothetical protein J5786_01265 [Clostridiales bacterium]|nr:hypothetical protein [Clostridiales bacterium]